MALATPPPVPISLTQAAAISSQKRKFNKRTWLEINQVVLVTILIFFKPRKIPNFSTLTKKFRWFQSPEIHFLDGFHRVLDNLEITHTIPQQYLKNSVLIFNFDRFLSDCFCNCSWERRQWRVAFFEYKAVNLNDTNLFDKCRKRMNLSAENTGDGIYSRVLFSLCVKIEYESGFLRVSIQFLWLSMADTAEFELTRIKLSSPEFQSLKVQLWKCRKLFVLKKTAQLITARLHIRNGLWTISINNRK